MIEKLGLSPYESKCYLTLVKYGNLSGKEIAKHSSVPPTSVYRNLEALQRKGFVQIIQKEPLMYQIVDPDIAIHSYIKISKTKIEIQKVIAAMEKYPSLRLKVNAHTDSRGRDEYNLWLSQKRAEATVDYMVSKGISRERLQGEGYGEKLLLNNCDDGVYCTKTQHQLNRRSEFIIME